MTTTDLHLRIGGRAVLDGADVHVGPGVTGLLGPNGAGKTTLIGLLLGLQRPTSGEVRVLGLDPTREGPRLRPLVGYSPQLQVLPPDVPAVDLVSHLAEVQGLPRSAARQRGSDALWLVGLGEERTRRVGTMSTGQVQRVKLACALAHDPRLLVLDEPTNGLDPVQREDLLLLVRAPGHRARHARAAQLAPAGRGRAGLRRRRHPHRRAAPAPAGCARARSTPPAGCWSSTRPRSRPSRHGLRAAGLAAARTHGPSRGPRRPATGWPTSTSCSATRRTRPPSPGCWPRPAPGVHRLTEPRHGLVDTYLATTGGRA